MLTRGKSAWGTNAAHTRLLVAHEITQLATPSRKLFTMFDRITRLRPDTTRMRINSMLCAAFLLVVAPACTKNSSGPTLTPGEDMFGTLEITVSTIGTNQDPDGYVVVVDEGTTQTIASDALAEFTVLVSVYEITLSGVAPNCSPSPNPLRLTVTVGNSSEGLIVVTCS